jgi:formate-nitrite transporter family protein
MADARAERIAENEARFRDINERLRGDLQPVADEAEAVRFVCECGNASCREGVALVLSDYRAVRLHPRRFAVVPGHEIADLEAVVERHDDYLVIEKPADVEHILEQH